MRQPPRLSASRDRRRSIATAFALAWGVTAICPTLAKADNSPGLAPFTVATGNLRRSPVVEVVEKVRGAVVNIHSERTVPGTSEESFVQGTNRVNGMGTGIIIDPRGYIITNHHVIEDVQVLRIRLSDGSTYPAKIVARDPETDLALLKVEPRTALQVMPLGTAGDLMIGESVIAIGNAFGYEHTVTTGVVSATKRDVTLNKEISYKSLIQTDASINPGNSGGPLINVYGELIGVNVAIRAGAQGIGFAIPVDQMIRVAADMISGRKRFQSLHELVLADRVEPGSSPAVRNLIVEQTEAVTQASTSGLLRGDRIVRVDDQVVANSLDFERAILGRKAGDKVTLSILRDGSERAAELTLHSLDRGTASETIWRKLGVRVNPTALGAHINEQYKGGLSVVDVSGEGPAGRSGIQRGDILVGLGQWETLTPDHVVYVINNPEATAAGPLKFWVIRAGQTRQGVLK